MKCSKCGDETPKNKIKYFHKQKLCKWCWGKLHPKEAPRKVHVAWIERNKEEIKREMMK
ncbi:MAG TPA: hypothetical protein VMZ91_04765 [Candidatus Paceibacterota bacterium]|nr:hypothetical protein [Candidatus Paceibacterota bacterium]